MHFQHPFVFIYLCPSLPCRKLCYHLQIIGGSPIEHLYISLGFAPESYGTYARSQVPPYIVRRDKGKEGPLVLSPKLG